MRMTAQPRRRSPVRGAMPFRCAPRQAGPTNAASSSTPPRGPAPPSAVPSGSTAREGAPEDARDDGRAIIEVVFLAVLLLIPTVYLMIGVLRVQAATLAVAQSARDVGRLIETSPGLPGLDDALAVARVALADQHVGDDGLRLATTDVGEPCTSAASATLTRAPGSDYDVCVTAVIDLPGVPTALTGSRNTVTGVYTVHIDPLREGAPAPRP